MQSANPRRWAALAVIALAQFMVIMDTSIIGVALPEIQTDLGFIPATCRGCSTPTSSPSAACCCSAADCPTSSAPSACSSPAGRSSPAGSLAAGLADTSGVEIAARAVQGVGAALIAPSALTLLMMLFGHDPKELMKAFAHLRRRRSGRRHRRRLPRRRDHRVDLVAVGVLHQHPDRARRARRHAGAHARRACSPRLDRPRRRAHRDGRSGADGVRRSSARRRRAGARRRRCSRWPAAWRCSALFVALQAGSARAADAPEHLPHPEPGRGEHRAVPARRRVDPDVVLPEPVPPAGARLRRVRGRRRAAADDRRDHGADGGRGPAGHRTASASRPPIVGRHAAAGRRHGRACRSCGRTATSSSTCCRRR